MRVLITGGAGYLGSILTPMFLGHGDSVTVLDNFMFRQTSLLDVCHNKNLQVLRGDVRDHELLAKQMAKHDVVIPLACLVGAPICDLDPYAAAQVNRDAIDFICKQKSKDQILVFPCTNSGYGIGQKGIYCDEQTPLNPISLYGRLKVEAEKMVLDAGGITFRFATLFGMSPKMRLDLLVNDFVFRAVRDRCLTLFEADFKRNYLHVRDGAAAFLFAVENCPKMVGEAFNVGLSDANLSKRELCQLIKKIIPQFVFNESSFNEDQDKRDYIVSNDKIERLGFKPRFSLQDGVVELVKGAEILHNLQFRNA